MRILEKLQYKLMRLLCRILGFTLDIEEKDNNINLNVKILTKKGKINFIKVISKVSDKLKKEEKQ